MSATESAEQKAAEVAEDATSRDSNQAQRRLAGILRKSAYATIGMGDLAVNAVARLNERAAHLRSEAPKALRERQEKFDARELSARLERGLERLRGEAEEELDRLSERGRTVVEQIQRNPATRRAVEQVSTARSQVKAAATSVTKAARLARIATEESVATATEDTATPDYDALTLDELRDLARDRDITGHETMERDALIEALRRE